MTDEEMADEWINNQEKNNTLYFGKHQVDVSSIKREAFLEGLKIGRQEQSGIGWIDTAHIEIKLHDAIENIKKQLDSIAHEILCANNKEVNE